jgi:hypothetical protein
MLADAQQEISAYGDPMYDTKGGQVRLSSLFVNVTRAHSYCKLLPDLVHFTVMQLMEN